MSFATHGSGNERCAYCHDLLAAVRPTTACPGCRTVLHDVCWRAATKCPTLGCRVLDPVPKPEPASRWLIRATLAWSAVALSTAIWSLYFSADRSGQERALPPAWLLYLGLVLPGLAFFFAAVTGLRRSPRRLAAWATIFVVLATLVIVPEPFSHGSSERPTSAVGVELMNAGKYREALEAFDSDPERAKQTRFYPWLQAAECHERLHEDRAALEDYDNQIRLEEHLPRVGLLVKRAHCMSRLEGPSAAAEWLERVATLGHDGDEGQRTLGRFHVEEGRRTSARAAFERAVQIASLRHGFVFDDSGWLKSDRNADSRKNGSDYSGILTSLKLLAEQELCEHEFDRALKTASMGVSIGQQNARVEKWTEEYIAAGDGELRLLRARALVGLGRCDEARMDIEHARVTAGADPFGDWVKPIREAEAELARAERKESER